MYGKIETGERFLSIYRAEQLASLYGLSFNEIYDEENPSPKIKMALRAKKDIKSGDIKFIAELNRLVLNSTWMESISNENRKISFPIEKVSDNVDKLELNTLALNCRKWLGVTIDGAIDIESCLRRIDGLTFVKVPMADNVSGMCLKNGNIICIAVNTNNDIGRQHFTMAHELYHLYCDNFGKSIICTSDNEKDMNEIRADFFASYFLAPDSSFREEVKKIFSKGNFSTIENVIYLSQLFSMSYKAVLKRLLKDGTITEELYSELKNTDITDIVLENGYSTKLYSRSEERDITGYYLKQVSNLFKSNKISNGKYEELLLDAGKYDIVFGDAHFKNGGLKCYGD